MGVKDGNNIVKHDVALGVANGGGYDIWREIRIVFFFKFTLQGGHSASFS